MHTNEPDYRKFSFFCVYSVDVFKAVSHPLNLLFDGLALKFLKTILPDKLPFISHLFNTIFTTCTFPSEWKISRRIPIPNKTAAESLSEFRPIVILAPLSKALVMLLQQQIRLLLSNQLNNKVMHNLRHAKDSKLFYTILVFLDFSKAFDSVRHKLL